MITLRLEEEDAGTIVSLLIIAWDAFEQTESRVATRRAIDAIVRQLPMAAQAAAARRMGEMQ